MHADIDTLIQFDATKIHPAIRSPQSISDTHSERLQIAPSRYTGLSMEIKDMVGMKADISNRTLDSSRSVNVDQEGIKSHPQLQSRSISLDELSNILHVRGRLQEMSAQFSMSGELLTYRNPPKDLDFAEMLRLGPLYDTNWSMLFAGNADAHDAIDGNMWSDLRTLKKMLRNKGITFGPANLRLSDSYLSFKLHRLCCAYNQLYEQWLAMMQICLPAQADEESDGESDNRPDDTGIVNLYTYDSDSTIVDCDLSQSSATINHTSTAWSSSIPRNIGWRFSDDIGPAPCNLGWHLSDDVESAPMRSQHHVQFADKLSNTLEMLLDTDGLATKDHTYRITRNVRNILISTTHHHAV